MNFRGLNGTEFKVGNKFVGKVVDEGCGRNIKREREAGGRLGIRILVLLVIIF